MREVLLFDPMRVPQGWTDLLGPGELAVFIVNHRSGQMLSPGGVVLTPETATCVLFANCASAEEFCSRIVSTVRGTRCEIYDKAGKAKPPLKIYIDPSLPKEEFRRARWGIGFIVAGVAMLIYDWTAHWDSIWGTAAGIKLVLVGGGFVLWDPLKSLDRKREK